MKSVVKQVGLHHLSWPGAVVIVAVCCSSAYYLGTRRAPDKTPAPATPQVSVVIAPPLAVAQPKASSPKEDKEDAPPTTLDYNFNAPLETQWGLRANTNTRAKVTFGEEAGGRKYARLSVDRFGAEKNGSYKGERWACLRTIGGPRNLRPYKTVTFRARGEGLSNVRLAVWPDDMEDWPAPSVVVSHDWHEYTLSLDTFYHYVHYTKNHTDAGWQLTNSGSIGRVKYIEFQVGDYVNSIDSRGHIDIDELKFE